jgi:trehalose 6-phosphate phosphatase
MRYILSRDSHPVLVRLARERTLCAFDFDGTIAPIAGHPDEASMRDRTRQLLDRLASMYPCIILSGRARSDLLTHLDGLPVERIIGNHGAEGEASELKVRRQVEKWKAALELEMVPMPGVWIEDKGLSLTVHYRQAPRKAQAHRLVLEAARKLEQVRVFGGKEVVNLVVPDAPDKGVALASERDRLGSDWVLFVGDDENDEEAFALAGNTVSVRVGRKRQSNARYYLRSQAEIDKFLELLVSLRSVQQDVQSAPGRDAV